MYMCQKKCAKNVPTSVLNDGTKNGHQKIPENNYWNSKNACKGDNTEMLHCNTVMSQCQNVALLQYNNAKATLSQCNNAIPLKMHKSA